jgi:Mrp family chromosome partitioning ATPase
LHEYLRGEAEPAQILQPLVPAGPASGGAADHLACIVAGSPTTAATSLLASDRCRHAVAMLRSAYDRVVLDGPPLGGERSSLEALAADAEAVIVCGRREELPKRPPVAGAEFVLVG